MKYWLILLITFVVIGLAKAEEPCYKPAPLPVYSESIGYGYREDVPCTNEKYPNAIIKAWQLWDSREIFVDKGKDGTCDIVYIYKLEDPEKDLWLLSGMAKCETIENQIKNFLKIQEEKKLL